MMGSVPYNRRHELHTHVRTRREDSVYEPGRYPVQALDPGCPGSRTTSEKHLLFTRPPLCCPVITTPNRRTHGRLGEDTPGQTLGFGHQ